MLYEVTRHLHFSGKVTAFAPYILDFMLSLKQWEQLKNTMIPKPWAASLFLSSLLADDEESNSRILKKP